MEKITSTDSLTIREYTDDTYEALKGLVIELQDSLRAIEPEVISSGEKVGDSYTQLLLDRIQKQQGKIFVARAEGRIIGFAAVFVSKEPDEDIRCLSVSDLVVTKTHRGKGAGTRLLQEAEKHAHSLGLEYMRIGSLAKNERATRLYRTVGFRDYMIILQKKLLES